MLRAMVTRPRLRSFFAALGLYVLVGLLIGYFGLHAYSGDHGLRARQEFGRQIAALDKQLDEATAERDLWERRVKLLKSESVDPDMLDERARALLDYVDARDLILIQKKP
jgi:cell division protein FtsB